MADKDTRDDRPIKLPWGGNAADILIERMRRAGGIARSADQELLAQLIRTELDARDAALRDAREEAVRFKHAFRALCAVLDIPSHPLDWDSIRAQAEGKLEALHDARRDRPARGGCAMSTILAAIAKAIRDAAEAAFGQRQRQIDSRPELRTTWYDQAGSGSNPKGGTCFYCAGKEEGAAAERAGMTEWEQDCLRWRGVVLNGAAAHWCRDWDGLPIDETCPEWPCICAAELIDRAGMENRA